MMLHVLFADSMFNHNSSKKTLQLMNTATRWQHGSVVKNPPVKAGDSGEVGLIPGSGRSPGVENGNPL